MVPIIPRLDARRTFLRAMELRCRRTSVRQTGRYSLTSTEIGWKKLRFLLISGQQHDITQADDLIANFDFERVIADRSYDADYFLKKIAEKEAKKGDIKLFTTYYVTNFRYYDE
jgi:hypothetical protein